MIVYENKGFETRSDMPNSDWTGNALYVVPDGSELANKIMTNYPYYDFVTDEVGNLIDVDPTERPPQPPPEPPKEYVTWDELAEAYREGVESVG